jgi:DNA polymerase-1
MSEGHEENEGSVNEFDAHSSKTKAEQTNGRPSLARYQTGGYVMIRERSELDAIASEIHASGQPIALDLETYGTSDDKKIRKGEALDPWRGEIRLLSLQLPDRVSWLIDLRATGYGLGELGKVLETTEVIGHNIKFDALWLARKCNVHLVKMVDTSSASQILSNGDSKVGNRLAEVADRYLGIELRKDPGRSDWGALMLLAEQIQYAAQDVEHLHALKEKLDAELKAAALMGVLRLEMDLLPVLVGMELIGFCVDRKKLEEIAAKATQERDQVAQTVNNLLGTRDVNLNAPAQLLKALQGLGIALKNTNEGSLSECRHPVAAAILEYRKWKKLKEDVESRIHEIRPDGRIHGQFNPLGTDTGRFSSSEPNMRNITRGELRTAFVASVGNVLVIADYSQIELRAAAYFSGDKRMIEAFIKGEDLHTKTASIVLGKSEKEITKEDRQLAKALNFGLLYGRSAEGLVRYAKTSYGVEMTEKQAAKTRAVFFKHYDGLVRWHAKAWDEVECTEVVEGRTILGRRRLIDPEASNWDRFQAKTNLVVQGACADGLKLGLCEIHKALPKDAKIIATVHDEIIVEAPEAQAEQVKKLLAKIMVSVFDKLFKKQVPIEVDAKICENWGENEGVCDVCAGSN